MAPTNSLRHTRQFLEKVRAPESAYSLGSSKEGAWCVVPAYDEARTGRQWEVFQLVDGEKRFPSVVSTEEGACDVLLGELGFGYLVPGLR